MVNLKSYWSAEEKPQQQALKGILSVLEANLNFLPDRPHSQYKH